MSYQEEPTLDGSVDTPRREALSVDQQWGLRGDASTPAPPRSALMPMPLDGFVAGIDPLDGLVVFGLTDGLITGAWVRGDAGFTADAVATGSREAYLAAMQSARALATFAATDRGPASEPIVTIETTERTVLLRRVRAFVVACVFDASIPLGMARLCATRLAADLAPELPLADLEPIAIAPPDNASPAPAARSSVPAARCSVPLKAARASPAEVERARRLISYAEANLPDAHMVRLRLALRAHTSRLSLDHPEALASEAVLRIETAVLEMLGMDREQLSRVLAESAPREAR